MESKALVSHIVMLYNDSIGHELMTTTERNDATPSGSFSGLSCEILHALVALIEDLGSNKDLGDVEECGIPLASASRMLQTIPQHLKKMTVSSLCIAPLNYDFTRSENIATFSKMVLSFLATNEMGEEASEAVLRRVALLTSSMEKLLDSDSEILDALLSCRSQFLRTCRKTWFQCLEAVVRKTVSSSSATLRIARAILDPAS
jgi:hypothetical protein